MYKVVKRLEFCYGHRLLSYEGKCAHLHGHNGILEIELQSTELDAQGMVCDFSTINAIAEKFVLQKLDHHLILHSHDPLIKSLREAGQEILELPANPTAENIAKFIFYALEEQGLPVSTIRVWESSSSYAEYYPGE
jgi:6-pyruvoyltetrahydropterin/6-carboxytetrahydropterin synthase